MKKNVTFVREYWFKEYENYVIFHKFIKKLRKLDNEFHKDLNIFLELPKKQRNKALNYLKIETFNRVINFYDNSIKELNKTDYKFDEKNINELTFLKTISFNYYNKYIMNGINQ